MTESAIRTERLRRVYQPRRSAPRVALDGIDLDVPVGEVHGLLGPNGAGKTTLVKILSTVLLPTEGRAEVLGRDVVRERDAVRRLIGSVFGGDRGLYGHVSVRRNMLFWASLYNIHGKAARLRVDQLIERVGLADRAEEPVENLSRGMVQRVHLARGLLNDPRLILLDEPTSGLDPVAALEFRTLIGELVADGRTILLTTHDLREAEALCARVSMVDRGRLLMTSAVADIGSHLATPDRVDFTVDPAAQGGVLAALAVHAEVASIEALEVPGRHRIHPSSTAGVAVVLRFLYEQEIFSVSTSPPSLEEVYLHVVGERGMAV